MTTLKNIFNNPALVFGILLGSIAVIGLIGALIHCLLGHFHNVAIF